MEWSGNPENREPPRPVSCRERQDRWANWSYDAEGTGQRSRGANPAMTSSGGSGSVRREWQRNPYNANARSNWGRDYQTQGEGSSSSSWRPYRHGDRNR